MQLSKMYSTQDLEMYKSYFMRIINAGYSGFNNKILKCVIFAHLNYLQITIICNLP